MNRRRFLRVGLLLTLICILSGRTNQAAERSDLPSQHSSPRPHAEARHPNIIFILTDDMALHDIEFMPKVKKLLIEEGTTFSNYFVTNSQCCPSRSSILRGQYVHNHGVESNQAGFRRFYELGNESSTIATWLNAAGYLTGYMGKYLNGYPDGSRKTHVPAGWTEWHAGIGDGGYKQFNYSLNENGKIVEYGRAEGDYLTDVLSRKATAFIRHAVEQKKPFFLHLSPFAPHEPAIPAPRHRALFEDAMVPRTASFNEKNVTSKPAYVRAQRLLNKRQIEAIDRVHRKRLQSLQAVDDLVEDVVETLQQTGELHQTYIVFSSDNGYHLGQHRLLPGKQTAYEEDIHVPLVIRGPDVPARRSVRQLAVETDLAPTFAEWASVIFPGFVDGRSLEPLLKKSLPALAEWRQGILIEHYTAPEPFMSWVEHQLFQTKEKPQLNAYRAVRSTRHLFVQYQSRERELYDLVNDPNQLRNIVAEVDARTIKRYSHWLNQLRKCKGADCRKAEDTRFDDGLIAP
jgi:N-acetylglucosamine-6-sulfatase